jgi:hypothetical protein
MGLLVDNLKAELFEVHKGRRQSGSFFARASDADRGSEHGWLRIIGNPVKFYGIAGNA